MGSQLVYHKHRVAGYCRVSTREQLEGWSIETQVATIKRECEKRFNPGDYELVLFIEEGESGTKGQWEPGARKGTYRSKFSDMVRLMAASEFDFLIVSQLNRIARASKVWHDLLDKYIIKGKVEFISIKEDFDTTTAAGRLHASLLVSVAEYQASEGAERVKIAMKERTKNGLPLGYRPYGWKHTPGDPDIHKRPGSAVVPEEAEWIKWMVEKYLLGWSFRHIANELMALHVKAPMGGDLWHLQVVRNIIFNHFHFGFVEDGGELIQGVHFGDRLFDPCILEQLEQVKSSRRKFPPNTARCSQALLAGLIHCACCGERLYVVHPRGEYRGYRCRVERAGGSYCEHKPYVRGEFVERRVIEEIGKIALNPEVQKLAFEESVKLLNKSAHGNRSQVDDIQSHIDETEHKLSKLTDLYLLEQIPDEVLATKSNELNLDMARYKSKMVEIQHESLRIKDIEAEIAEVGKILSNFPKLWDGMNFEERRAMLDILIEKLEADQFDGRIRITLKLSLIPEICFDIPVVNAWMRRGGENRQAKTSLRALGLLYDLNMGLSIDDIQIKWGTSRSTILAIRQKLLKMLEVSTIEEAIEKGQPLLDEWGEYARSSGRYGAAPGASSSKPLTGVETQVIKLIAAGYDDKDVTEATGFPASTVGGIRARIREKLKAKSGNESVARAVKVGIIGPNEPSPVLLLKIYQEIVDGKHATLMKRGLVKMPSSLQIAMLNDIAGGVEAYKTAECRKISLTAVGTAKKRMWGVVGGADLKSALKRVSELGMLSKSSEENEDDKT